jgi:hypothetical protein
MIKSVNINSNGEDNVDYNPSQSRRSIKKTKKKTKRAKKKKAKK